MASSRAFLSAAAAIGVTFVASAAWSQSDTSSGAAGTADLQKLAAQVQAPVAGPNPIASDGTVAVAGFALPPSLYLSDQARAAMPHAPHDPDGMMRTMTPAMVAQSRQQMGRLMAPQIAPVRALYHVTTREGTIAGVPAAFFTPDAGVPRANTGKILLNLPGGGFVMGVATGTGALESIPLAALAGIEIVSITYRQAPETHFPAATDDVVAVYRELLRTHKPQDIGIFGCSAGGALTAEAMARFQKERLPMPAAIGIFCASADMRGGGDSAAYNRPFQGLAPSAMRPGYFDGTDRSDPMVSPIMSPKMLSHFPPTLLISSTRAHDLSGAVATHNALQRAHVESQLRIWDGLGHAFFYDPRLPESREAFDAMAEWFAGHLHLAAPSG